MDSLNQLYFDLLTEKDSNQPAIRLAESPDSSHPCAFSTAVAPPALLENLPTTGYGSLEKKTSGDYILVRKKMYAGIGSSIERKTHLEKHRPQNTNLGAKGTDLFIEIPNPLKPNERVKASLAEAQLIQGILSVKRQTFSKVVFEDLVSDDTVEALDTIWKLPCLLDRKKSYEQYVRENPALQRGKTLLQTSLPTLTRKGERTLNRKAPGGHGFFGFETLYSLLSNAPPPKNQFSFLSNGEDLAAAPDPTLVHWMMAQRIPLCMVVTEKTSADKKGGQLAVVPQGNGLPHVALIETAQAKAANQLTLFEELGLTVKRPGQMAYFNTNLAVFQEAILREKILDLSKTLGEKKFWSAVAPEVIFNWKKQVDSDGVERDYLQLEGAMGSVFLNLDKLSRKIKNEPLVHFLLVSKADRSRFFAPIKRAEDLFQLYYSGYYEWDLEKFCVLERKGASPPVLTSTSDDVEIAFSELKEKINS